jgi:hypothetical protein
VCGILFPNNDVEEKWIDPSSLRIELLNSRILSEDRLLTPSVAITAALERGIVRL